MEDIQPAKMTPLCLMESSQWSSRVLDTILTARAMQHGDQHYDGLMSEHSRRTSVIWKYFTRKPNHIACCNFCNKDYSFKSTVSNLTKHWRKKHGQSTNDDTTDCSDDEASHHSDNFSKSFNKSKHESESQSTWQYFEILDSDEFIARCKICENDIPYDKVSDLTEHAKEHNALVSDDEEWVDAKEKEVVNQHLKRANASAVWRYMKVTDEEARNAVCLLCKKQLSFMSSISNLRKHVKRCHPHISLEPDTVDSNEKKVIIATDGQLYEIASDGEKDPIQTEDVYLDDSMDKVIIERIEPAPKRRKEILDRKPMKRKLFQNTSSIIDIDDICDDTPNKNTSNPTSLDLFAQYVISLLKQLPKHVSDQLQSDIIKQIFTAKIALETPYQVNEEGVTVTINTSTNNSIPEITVQNTSDVNLAENADKSNDTVIQNGD